MIFIVMYLYTIIYGYLLLSIVIYHNFL